MGLFGKRKAPVAADNTMPTTHREKKSTSHKTGGSRAWNSKPTFGQWIKATWVDLLTMAVLGAIGLGVYFADPAPSRSFPVIFKDGEIVYPQFAYPLRNEIIPIWAAALMAFFIPFAVFLIVQIRARSFWDINNATIGLLYGLITAAVFQVFVKWLIGGFRPHFLAVCKPVIPSTINFDSDDNGVETGTTGNVGNGFRQIMFDRSICTGDRKEINDSLESMPSGHTTAAFAGFVFLYLYLNAKLKVYANYHPAMWKLIALYAPILGACLIGGALTIDEYHNWYDVLGGACIGTACAISAFRMVYASIWDFRFNHIPLLRHSPFTYGTGASTDGFHDAIFTRKAGWGSHEGHSLGGAPGDAMDGPHGTMAPTPEGPFAAHGSSTGRHSVPRRPVGGDGYGEQMV
ncbi:acid phosphatase/Vanadium-dependent haloperoxidase [Dothidotthia symphoricarpi CBS 119687]|uniref:Acid phosphatase/Vanadium-dependent haloperoxidase n=1 Tax=Dothidotthia symphoricarpi CBS 119687 TaxID=1392245 RepID=A0A6A6ARI9_9PLEO|nr:acid phosphatase/Vanadium-dependent haloperoxidase [Dothidotthia symphoricarpi CBS 119687]KAF2133564.1 acid phosphatase/Vanadium-dependent haloperoxidase [Dothidotthia symphoricarpi CBS 119687]